MCTTAAIGAVCMQEENKLAECEYNGHETQQKQVGVDTRKKAFETLLNFTVFHLKKSVSKQINKETTINWCT